MPGVRGRDGVSRVRGDHEVSLVFGTNVMRVGRSLTASRSVLDRSSTG